MDLSPGLRRELLRYLGKNSEERAHVIAELAKRKPVLADVMMDLETDDDLRARFEIHLLRDR